MNLLTLLTVRTDLWTYGSTVPFSTATTQQKADFDAKLNLVLEKLLLEMEPRHTIRRVVVPIYDSTITLPRTLLSCSGVKLIPNGTNVVWQQPLRIYGNNHEFHNGPIPADDCTGAVYPTNQLAQTFRTPSAAFKLRVKATEAGGNMSLIGGTDSSSTELFAIVTLAITNGTTTTTQVYNTLPQIQKPVTTNKVELYSVDNVTAAETLIAVYAPGETVPAYMQYTVSNPSDSPSCLAKCKLAFVKVVADTDIVYPGLYSALRLGLKALNREENEQPEAADQWWKRAVDAMDKDRIQIDGEAFPEFAVEPNIAFGDMPYTI